MKRRTKSCHSFIDFFLFTGAYFVTFPMNKNANEKDASFKSSAREDNIALDTWNWMYENGYI